MKKKFTLRRGLAFKMILLIFSAVAGTFIITFIYNYVETRQVVIKDLNLLAEKYTESTVNKVDRILHGISKVPENLKLVMEKYPFSEDQLDDLLKLIVENNPDIYGTAIAFEPQFDGRKERYYSFYAYRDSTGVKLTTLGNASYDYHIMDWYQIPRETGKSYWTEPYYDEGGGNILMSTYSVPLYRTNATGKEFIGVLTADLSLAWLSQLVDSIRVFETGYGFLLSQNGTIVTHPMKELIMNASLFSLAEELNTPELKEIGRRMIRKESGFFTLKYRNIYTKKLSWIAFQPVQSNGWSLAVVFPVEEFMADAHKLNVVLVILGIAGLTLIFILVLLISRSITKPLRKLAQAAESFADGDFDVHLPDVQTKDEIGRLTTSFRYMQKTLAETIGNLQSLSEELRISNDKLEEYSKTLEIKVDERTAELVAKNRELDRTLQSLKATQTQLVQSEKMASLGQLTAGIAHEIKNPLNFVNNFAESSIDLAGELKEEMEKLKDTIKPADFDYLLEILGDLQSNARKISDHGKRADSIIRGMLLHSRGKSGERQPTDINALLDEYVNLGYHGMRATDPSFNIKIEKFYDPEIGQVNVVPQDLSRVFLNIINNACQATIVKKNEQKDTYFPVLTIVTKRIGQTLEIRIKDNGKGIPPEVREKIFMPFFTTKAAGQGTGLGLSISYDIVVQEHRGEIVVESEPGQFTEFIVRIPLDQQP